MSKVHRYLLFPSEPGGTVGPVLGLRLKAGTRAPRGGDGINARTVSSVPTQARMSPDTCAPPRCARHAGVGESGQRTATSQCLGPGTQASLSCRSSAVPMPHGKCVMLKDLRSDRVRPTGGGGLVVRVKQLENELHYFRKVGGKDSPPPPPFPGDRP